MKLAVVPVDKTIVVDGEGITISLTDISWIPSDVWAAHWDSTTNTGEIEYNDGKPNVLDATGIVVKTNKAITEINWQLYSFE